VYYKGSGSIRLSAAADLFALFPYVRYVLSVPLCILLDFTARRYASAVYAHAVVVWSSVCPSIRHKPVLYQNG